MLYDCAMLFIIPSICVFDIYNLHKMNTPVLYVPSHWFHYIVSLQKSAQCNVRSGINFDGNVHFGGRNDVEQCIDDNQQQQS